MFVERQKRQNRIQIMVKTLTFFFFINYLLKIFIQYNIYTNHNIY